MDLLLDTHALLWHYLDDPKLSVAAKILVADPANRVFVSPATHWEIAETSQRPFDRLLIAQAVVEKMPIVSVDAAFTPYPVQLLW